MPSLDRISEGPLFRFLRFGSFGDCSLAVHLVKLPILANEYHSKQETQCRSCDHHPDNEP